MKKSILLISCMSVFVFGQNTNAQNEAILNNFIGNSKVTTAVNTASCPKAVKTTYSAPAKRVSYKKRTRRYVKRETTYFINYDRPLYKEVDRYKTYNMGDLEIDHKKQLDEEVRKKDTL